jgi:acetyl-CoA synthetase
MSGDTESNWIPTPEQIDTAQVTALAVALEVGGYDELHHMSIARPDQYWRVVLDFLGIVWSTPPRAHVDLARGAPFPDWFPGGTLNWVDSVLRWAQDPATLDRPAVVAETESGGCESLTYIELAEAVRRMGAGLRGRGVARGDRIGLLMENGIEATVSLLAIAGIGAVAVPLFSGFGVDAIVSRLQQSAASCLITTVGYYRRGRFVDIEPTIAEALTRLPSVRTVIWKGSAKGELGPDGLDWNDVALTTADVGPLEVMSPDDPFLIIYTSGTTGKPKGAVHTHGGFPLKIAHDAAVHFNLDRGDVFCWPADMGWIAGTLVLSCALLRGATLVCFDGAPDFPDWSRMSRLIKRHKVTHFGSAPTLIRGLAANAAQSLAGGLSSVRLLITAGEGIDPDHFTWFRIHFGGANNAPLINYTGGTEVSGALLSSVIVRPIAPASFNTGSPGVDVAVVDPAGKTVVGGAGELAIKAPFVGMTHSFWHDDARYLETYWQIVPGMWIHGDLALRRDDGSYLMLGRSDDTLKIAGKRLGPAEVEELLMKVPPIREAAAIGIADGQKGEKLGIFVVTTPGWTGDEDELATNIARLIEERLGKPFKPGLVRVVSQLPKTRSSKVMRRLIKRVCAGEALGDLTALDNPAALDELRVALAGAKERGGIVAD